MKKKIISITLIMCYSAILFADYNPKLTFQANSFFAIHKYAKENNKSAQSNLPLNSEGEEMIKLYIKVDSNYDKSDIEILDGKEVIKTKSIALVQLPIKNVELLSQYDFIEKIDIIQKVEKHLDRALPSSNVDKVHQGTNLKSSYTGKGVLVGVGDWGFDFTHTMFSDAWGRPRIKRAWLTDVPGVPPARMEVGHLFTDSNEIQLGVQFSSEKAHGTHVLGIAAGSSVKAEKSIYSGIAKEADIVVVDLEAMHDGISTDLLEATEYMFRYADSVGKPISVNYSLGLAFSQHSVDGESLVDIAMSELLQANPKGKIVTASAGNSGTGNIHSKVELGYNDSFFVNIPFPDPPLAGYGRIIEFSIWGEDDTPFTADLYYKNGDQQIKYASFNTNNPDADYGINTVVTDSIFYFVYYRVSLPLYPAMRPSIVVYIARNPAVQSIDSCYVVVKGSNTTINMWNYRNTNYSQPMSSNFKPDNNFTINSPGSIEEVVTVGAYVSRNLFRQNGDVGDIAYFSSKGPLTNGKIKPDITAPGSELVSAKNNFSDLYDNSIYDRTSDNLNHFVSLSGTSMSSPMVAGIIALMLEKKPDLTQAEVKEIIQITALNDQYTGNVRYNKDPVWGWGKIDAQAIMKYLEETNIDEKLNMDLYVFPNPTTEYVNIIFDNPAASYVKIDILNAIGQVVSTPINQYYDAGIRSFNVADLKLPTGTYFIRINTNKTTQQKSFIVW